MLKLGIVDFDTSHVVEFTKRLNGIGVPDEQRVEGARIVIGCPGVSRVMSERIPGFTKTMAEELRVPLVEKAAEMLGKIDALLIESNDGSAHLERARPFLEAGIPLWIDKPLAWTVREAEAIAELAARKNVPVFSASSARFAPEVVAVKAAREELGPPLALHAFGPQNDKYKQKIPGWFFYGIHCVETLFEILGPGHGPLHYLSAGDAEHASSSWKNQTVAAISLSRKGERPSGFTYIGEKNTRTVLADGSNNYRELLKRIVASFATGTPPVRIEESIEVIRYLEEVNRAGAAA